MEITLRDAAALEVPARIVSVDHLGANVVRVLIQPDCAFKRIGPVKGVWLPPRVRDPLRARGRAMRRSREQWAEIVGAFEGSGLSHEAFCAQERLNMGSFRGWLYRLGNGSERGNVARSATRLLPVRVGPPGATGDEELIEVAVGGVVVRVRSSVDPAYVAELVTRLRDRC